MNSLAIANAAVERAWAFAACYPSVNVKSLIMILDDIRNSISDIAALMGMPLQRKLNAIRSDPKTPQHILCSTEEAVKQILGEFNVSRVIVPGRFCQRRSLIFDELIHGLVQMWR